MLKDKAASSPQVRKLEGYEPVEIAGDEVAERLVIRDIETGKQRTLGGRRVHRGGPGAQLGPAARPRGTNQRGEVVVDEWGDTGVRGVFAAGDVTAKKDKQIVIAAGEGAKAALAAFDYLITQR